MRLNLSSEIVLNKVPLAYYKPKTTVEYSEISRMEKIHTDIFASSMEGAAHVADQVEKEIKAAQHEGRYYVMALGTGLSLTPIYKELQRRCEAKQLSFRNVVVFNAYEYYPVQKESSLKSINQLKERFLDHVDIDPQNIFTLDGSVAQDAVQDTCHLYEKRIKTFGGLDIALLGIGRMGNIAANEPGSGIQSITRLILIGNTSREEMENSFGTNEQVPPCSLTMGIATLLSAKSVYLTAWGDEKAEIMQKVVEGNITDTLPASFLQTHPNANVIDTYQASLARNKLRVDRQVGTQCIGMALPEVAQAYPEVDQQGLQREWFERALGSLRLCIQCKHQDLQRLAAYYHRLARR